MANDFTDWSSKRMKVTNLRLDPENPRLPPTTTARSQNELLGELIRHDDVYGLAKSIATIGYFPTDSLIAIQDEDGGTYVIEGNRRLAALKALLSPTSAPESEQKRFLRLSSQISLRSISEVKIMLAPSREATIPLIVDRHTQTQVEKWSPAMQAHYFRTLADAGHDPEDIARLAHVTVSKVHEALRNDSLYRLACRLELEPEVKAVVSNPRRFTLSTLERAMEYDVVQKFLGVRVSGENIEGYVDGAEFIKGFRRLVIDIARENGVTSRTLNNEPAVRQYLDEFGPDAPDTTKVGAFNLDDLAPSVPPSELPAEEPPPSKSRTPRVSDSILPTDLRCEVTSSRVKDVFKELKTLRLSKYENASALMLRTLLDLAVTHHLDASGKSREVTAKFQKQQKKSREWAPTLRQQLTYLLENVDHGLTGQKLAALIRFTEDKAEAFGLDSLDKFVHNTYTPPSATDLRKIYTTLDPLMRVLMKEPEKQPS